MGKSVTLKTKIGHSQLEVQADSFKEICDYSTLIGKMPRVCGKCGSDSIYLYHKTPKGYDYFGLACKDCSAELSFHTKRDTGAFFIKDDDEWTVFRGGQQGGQQEAGQEKPAEQMTADTFQSDIPF
jgi:hypothetical protein